MLAYQCKPPEPSLLPKKYAKPTVLILPYNAYWHPEFPPKLLKVKFVNLIVILLNPESRLLICLPMFLRGKAKESVLPTKFSAVCLFFTLESQPQLLENILLNWQRKIRAHEPSFTEYFLNILPPRNIELSWKFQVSTMANVITWLELGKMSMNQYLSSIPPHTYLLLFLSYLDPTLTNSVPSMLSCSTRYLY